MAFEPVDLLVSLILFLVMLGVGSSLTLRDVKNVFRFPRELFLGLALQLLALPVIAFLLVEWSGLSPALKVGVIVLAACPGGSTSNFISYLVRAKTALSISLTTVNSIITLFSIPLVVNLALMRYLATTGEVSLPFFQTILNIFVVVLFPAALGMLLRHYHRKAADKLENPIKAVSLVLLAGMFAVKFFADQSAGGTGLTLGTAFEVLPFVLGLHVFGLAVGFFSARRAGFSDDASVTLGIEVGLQNTTLAILVASALLDSPAVTRPALVYAVFSFVTTALFGWGMKRVLARRHHLPLPRLRFW
ncbi:bile acid:sodium symporter family protein [Candidatus Woesearchaeota archaeon]|nr:bile acid:sodium symporter family protein [Candidatus Woesearchaeota archaeon]